jgi:hypothetical protein
VKNFNGNREQAVAGHAKGGGGGSLGRRGVLGGLAALPVLYGVGMAGSARAAVTASPSDSAPSGSVTAAASGSVPAADDLVLGAERRYNAPLLAPGARLVLPKGIKAVPVLDYYHRPHLASAESEWPYVTAANGMRVDASVIPERGAPTRVAVLTGFTDGWYDVIHASGRADHVTWDAGKFPVLLMYAEFGGTNEAPYHNWIYALALRPLSRNPYSRSTLAR